MFLSCPESRNEAEVSVTKFLHLADLHIGRRLNECSLLDDQRHILGEIVRIAGEERPDGVLIAGDLYDKPVPPAEAVALCDRFLVELAALGTQVFLIAGNHDSPERLAFGAQLMAGSGVHVAPVYNGSIHTVPMQDAFGTVEVCLLPFLKPTQARRAFPEAEITSYTDALKQALGTLGPKNGARRVLLAHQFVTGAARSDSEECSVGGCDKVDAAVFDGFDYVALGHLHRAQNVGSDRLRYAGSPLKYSFAEARHEKSVTVVELGCPGACAVRTVPLTPLRELAELRGSYEELTRRSRYENTSLRDDYVRITLTDEQEIPDAVGRLRVIYRGLLRLDYDNTRTRQNAELRTAELSEGEEPSPFALFDALYQTQNNRPMTPEQAAFLQELIDRIWEGSK